MWLVGIFLWAASGGAFTNNEDTGGMILALSALGIAGLIFGCRRRQPLSYQVDDLGVVIEDRRGEEHIAGPVTLLQGARLGARVMGSGGLYGYFGRFRLKGGGGVRAFVTNRSAITILRVGEVVVAVSAADRAGFESELRHADA